MTNGMSSTPTVLHAGPVSLLYDPENTFLRSFHCDGHEILRAVYATIRDHYWTTIPATFHLMELDSAADRFRIVFRADHSGEGVEYDWTVTATGEPDGTVKISFSGASRNEWRRNRIGFCILHPFTLAGKPMGVTHTDGADETIAFPDKISPKPVVTNIRTLRHSPAPGLDVEVTCEGDAFEMEDQRNWTDASWKTYSTPVSLPRPVPVQTGDRVEQTVTIRVKRSADLVPATPKAAAPAAPVRPAFSLGTCLGQDLTDADRALLRTLPLQHLRAEIDFAKDWRVALERAAREAAALNLALYPALFLTENAAAEMKETMDLLAGTKVGLWKIFDRRKIATPNDLAALAHETLGRVAPVAAGSDAYFAAVNMNRPSADAPWMICFPTQPQSHATDRMTIIENVETLPVVLDSAAALTNHQLVLGPVTMQPRFRVSRYFANPDTDPKEAPPPDLRSNTPMGRDWTTATLAKVAAFPRIHSVSLHTAVGPHGLVHEGKLTAFGEAVAAVQA